MCSRWARLSCGFEANSADEGVEIVDDALVETVELGLSLPVQAAVG